MNALLCNICEKKSDECVGLICKYGVPFTCICFVKRPGQLGSDCPMPFRRDKLPFLLWYRPCILHIPTPRNFQNTIECAITSLFMTTIKIKKEKLSNFQRKILS